MTSSKHAKRLYPYEYVLVNPNKETAIFLLGYDENQNLVYLEAGEETTPQQLGWVYDRLPVTIEVLGKLKEALAAKGRPNAIQKKPMDTSFVAFWEAYNYKKGKKTDVQKKWEAMPYLDQVHALLYIRKYDLFLKSKNDYQQKMYPSSYLNAREWTN